MACRGWSGSCQPTRFILLKLYAGGTQDLWDIRELLRLPERADWIAAVELDLAVLPAFLRARWHSLRRES